MSKVAHNNPQIPLFQFYQLLRHFEWTGFWVNGDFTLTHRFHTFLDFLKCTRKKKVSMSWQDLSHYFGTDVSTGFLAIAKFVECFAHLMLVWPLLSTKSDLLAFYLSKLHPVRANISVSMMDSLVWSERKRKEHPAQKFCKRNIHLFVSALWRLLPFLPLSSSNSSHERLWVKVSCFEASSALVPFQSSLSPGHASFKSTESSTTGLRFLTSWCAGQKRSLILIAQLLTRDIVVIPYRCNHGAFNFPQAAELHKLFALCSYQYFWLI